jgi:hypothetical protein
LDLSRRRCSAHGFAIAICKKNRNAFTDFDLWAGKQKATPPPGAKQHVSNRALKQTRIPSMAELMFMGKDIFFPVFTRTALDS